MPRRHRLAVLVTALLTAGAAAVWAESRTPRVCGGQAGEGLRDVVAEALRAWPEDSPAPRLLETRGAMQSLGRLAAGDCDAALVQGDALFMKRMKAGPEHLMIAKPVHLYDRLLHLICHRDTAVGDIMDLLRAPRAQKVFVGAADSASRVTWQTLEALDRRLAAVPSEALAGEPALLAGDDKGCLLRVAAPGRGDLPALDSQGGDLRLVPLDIWYLNAAEDMAAMVYKPAQVPAGSYANLQQDLAEPAVETFAVGVYLVARRDWAETDAAAFRQLRQAIEAAAARAP